MSISIYLWIAPAKSARCCSETRLQNTQAEWHVIWTLLKHTCPRASEWTWSKWTHTCALFGPTKRPYQGVPNLVHPRVVGATEVRGRGVRRPGALYSRYYASRLIGLLCFYPSKGRISGPQIVTQPLATLIELFCPNIVNWIQNEIIEPLKLNKHRPRINLKLIWYNLVVFLFIISSCILQSQARSSDFKLQPHYPEILL